MTSIDTKRQHKAAPTHPFLAHMRRLAQGIIHIPHPIISLVVSIPLPLHTAQRVCRLQFIGRLVDKYCDTHVLHPIKKLLQNSHPSHHAHQAFKKEQLANGQKHKMNLCPL